MASADSTCVLLRIAEKDTPIKYEDETVLAHGPVPAFCRALIRCIAVTKNFVKPAAAGRRWAIPKIWSLLPDATAAEGHIFGGCEFIRYDDRP